MKANISPAETIIARCRELAQISDVGGQTTRTFLSPATRKAHALVEGWMQTAGLQVRTDSVGNLRGVLEGVTAHAPRLLIGSHLDTVVDAGAFDGPLGVMMGIALVETVSEEGPPPFALELIAFSEEEGVRFGRPFLGSLGVVGQLDDATLALADQSGITVREAMADFGLDPAGIAAAALDPGAFGYLEFHIEQGPVLDSEAISLAIVAAIAGQTRMRLTFRGRANHAGTTPMGRLRRDAVAAAAEWISDVERYAGSCAGLVATVGKVEVPDGAGNVIAGTCVTTLDVRHAEDEIRRKAVGELLDAAARAGSRRRVAVEQTMLLEQAAVPMDLELTAAIAAACARTTKAAPRRMVSGAGHDAMVLARHLPAAMIFVRSPEGLSHHPQEAVLAGDVEAAYIAGLEFLRTLRDDKTMLNRLIARARDYSSEVRHA